VRARGVREKQQHQILTFAVNSNYKFSFQPLKDEHCLVCVRDEFILSLLFAECELSLKAQRCSSRNFFGVFFGFYFRLPEYRGTLINEREREKVGL
jgi:hypothetical protein